MSPSILESEFGSTEEGTLVDAHELLSLGARCRNARPRFRVRGSIVAVPHFLPLGWVLVVHHDILLCEEACLAGQSRRMSERNLHPDTLEGIRELRCGSGVGIYVLETQHVWKIWVALWLDAFSSVEITSSS